jgi:hypothetical protein
MPLKLNGSKPYAPRKGLTGQTLNVDCGSIMN